MHVLAKMVTIAFLIWQCKSMEQTFICKKISALIHAMAINTMRSSFGASPTLKMFLKCYGHLTIL